MSFTILQFRCQNLWQSVHSLIVSKSSSTTHFSSTCSFVSCHPDSAETVLKVVCVVLCVLVAKLCLTLAIPWTVTARLLCPWDSPGKNTGVGCHFLLQRIFPTQESIPGLLHCRQMFYQLSCEVTPKSNGISLQFS